MMVLQPIPGFGFFFNDINNAACTACSSGPSCRLKASVFKMFMQKRTQQGAFKLPSKGTFVAPLGVMVTRDHLGGWKLTQAAFLVRWYKHLCVCEAGTHVCLHSSVKGRSPQDECPPPHTHTNTQTLKHTHTHWMG